jgi:tRNA(fMet)-specific endonuclease VapC
VLQDVGLSTIALGELETGVQKSAWPIENRARLIQFCTPLVVVRFDEEASRTYGEIRANLERLGTVIGALDMLIAAHAVSLGATLVTSNVREFASVPSLRLENWR